MTGKTHVYESKCVFKIEMYQTDVLLHVVLSDLNTILTVPFNV